MFIGDANIEKGQASNGFGTYYSDHYEVSPRGLLYQQYYYDENKIDYEASDTNKLVKIATIKVDAGKK